jgi:hypothetical protein
MEGAIQWVRDHTRADDRFIGPVVLRVAARRSVLHDHKGASLLIEKSPQAFMAWADRQRALWQTASAVSSP